MTRNPARFVYGTVVVGALLAAESAARETYLETVAAIVLAVLAYWVAESYAVFTARRLQRTERLTLGGLRSSMTHETPLLLGALVPILTVVGCWIGAVQLTSGVNAGLWTAVAMTLVIEVVAALRARLTGLDLVVQTAFGLLLGVLVIGIKLVLH
jgi:Na+/H+ antiporter NhaC